MHDPGYEFLRILLLSTCVNRARRRTRDDRNVRRVQQAVMEADASGGTLLVVGLSPAILSHAPRPTMVRKVHLWLHLSDHSPGPERLGPPTATSSHGMTGLLTHALKQQVSLPVARLLVLVRTASQLF